MNTPERFSLKFFEVIIQAAKKLSQEEIEKIESGEMKVCLVIDEARKNVGDKLSSESDIESLYEIVKDLDPEKRNEMYKSKKMRKKHIEQIERKIKRASALKDIATFSEQSTRES
jgi:hypothetical protein